VDFDGDYEWKRVAAAAAASEENIGTSSQMRTVLPSNRVPSSLSNRDGRNDDTALEFSTHPVVDDACPVVGERGNVSALNWLLEADVECDSTIFVPEATLVNEEEVIIATPLEPAKPWWKQHRKIYLLPVVLLVLVISSALMEAPSPKKEPMTSPKPTETASPTVDPTIVISSALMEASSPKKEPMTSPKPTETASPTVDPTMKPLTVSPNAALNFH
jgi:hypothetical protein